MAERGRKTGICHSQETPSSRDIQIKCIFASNVFGLYRGIMMKHIQVVSRRHRHRRLHLSDALTFS